MHKDGATLRAIDLCCGAGGWSCAARDLPVSVELGLDLWDVCRRTHTLNHPRTQFLQTDIRQDGICDIILKAVRHRRIDLIRGAIPWEWLTTRRSRAMHNEPSTEELAAERATLEAALRIIKRLKPRWWCLEDVVQLERELPPGTPCWKCNSAMFSAQARRRLYVGKFPAPILVEPATAVLARDVLRPGPYRIGRRAAARDVGRSRTFRSDMVYGQGLDEKFRTVTAISSRRDAEFVIVDPAIPGGRRQVEWQELAAAQGFPADYVFYGSPGDVVKQVGRAIQIDTGRAILREIVRDAL